MKPTPTELALIAATLARGADPKQFLAKARELYAACDAELTPPPPAQNNNSGIVPFDVFLLLLMSNETPSRRKKRFHGFFAYTIEKLKREAGEDPTDLEIESITRTNEEVLKREGIPVGTGKRWLKDFHDWHKARVSSIRATSAKRMHAKRQAIQKAKELERAANSKAIEKKSRLEFHTPEALDAIRKEQEQPTGRKTQRHLHD